MQMNLNVNQTLLLGAACLCITIIFMGIFITAYICRFIKKNIIGVTYDEKIRQLQTNVDKKIDEMKEEMGYSYTNVQEDYVIQLKENDEESIKIQKGEENIFEEIINEYLT
ncbi:MAG: hypothetical protein E7267_02060 [Lachnospiraceae bacterium]|nr:hypothetical protein [Lachnospiraceae bacterium]